MPKAQAYQAVTISINSELVEDVLMGWLYANNLIPEKDSAAFLDLGLNVDEQGLTEVDVFYPAGLMSDEFDRDWDILQLAQEETDEVLSDEG